MFSFHFNGNVSIYIYIYSLPSFIIVILLEGETRFKKDHILLLLEYHLQEILLITTTV